MNRYLLKLSVRCLAAMVMGIGLTIIGSRCTGLSSFILDSAEFDPLTVSVSAVFVALSLGLFAVTFLVNGHPK